MDDKPNPSNVELEYTCLNCRRQFRRPLDYKNKTGVKCRYCQSTQLVYLTKPITAPLGDQDAESGQLFT